MMNEAAQLFNQITATYRKYGWKLRRLLLTDAMRRELTRAAVVGDVPVEPREINAAWFVRASGKDREAWELRLLAPTPFALVETFAANSDDEQRERRLREIETQLIENRRKQ